MSATAMVHLPGMAVAPSPVGPRPEGGGDGFVEEIAGGDRAGRADDDARVYSDDGRDRWRRGRGKHGRGAGTGYRHAGHDDAGRRTDARDAAVGESDAGADALHAAAAPDRVDAGPGARQS